MEEPRARETVLGHYPEYLEEAKRRQANFFDIPPEKWKKMTTEQRWVANRSFLDDAIARGDEFILATPLYQLRPASYFERELEYLAAKGYQLTADQRKLVRKENP
jgi:hypothetical protein